MAKPAGPRRLSDSGLAAGERESDSDSDEDFAWGVGAGVTLFDRFNAKLEYESIEIEEGDLEIYWLTGAWRF